MRAGKVRYVGFSNWPAWMAAKAVGLQRARGYEPFRAAEMYYSLLGRDLEHDCVPFCLDAGVGVMVWSPLAGGFLSGKYTRAKPQGETGDRLGGLTFLPYDKERGYALIDLLTSIGNSRGATPAQVSLAWLLTRPAVASVLVGASNRKQLDENLKAAQIELTADDLVALDAATRPAAVGSSVITNGRSSFSSPGSWRTASMLMPAPARTDARAAMIPGWSRTRKRRYHGRTRCSMERAAWSPRTW